MASKYNDKKVYVSNIPKEVDSKRLQAHFEQFGSVYSAVVIGAKRGKSLLYGFVSFTDRKVLEKVLKVTHLIEGQELAVDTVSIEKDTLNLYKYAQGDMKKLYLFVQDIPKDINRKVLVDYFSRFGELTRATLVAAPGKNKSRVYLQYSTLESSAQAKSIKHKIPQLSSENVTLVCKVGIFKGSKHDMFEEGENLLTLLRPSFSSLSFVEGTQGSKRNSLRKTEASFDFKDTKAYQLFGHSKQGSETPKGLPNSSQTNFNSPTKGTKRTSHGSRRSTMLKVLEKSKYIHTYDQNYRFNVQIMGPTNPPASCWA